MTIDVSLIPQNRVENLISKLSEIENNIGNIGTDITNNLVHKTGDETISGLKIIENNIFLKDTQGTIGTSTNQWARRIQFADSTGERIARLEPLYFDATTLQMGMYASNGTTTESGIWVRNTGETYAPHPATAQDSSNKIATTAWVNNLDNSVVHKTGNETITGTKTYNIDSYDIYKSTSMDVTNKPSESHSLGTNYADKNGNIHGQSFLRTDSNGSVIQAISCLNHSQTSWAQFSIGFDSNDNIFADLNGNLIKGFVKETWQSGANWYRVWSDGWIEQGGYLSWNGAWTTLTFNRPFTTTNYYINGGGYRSDSSPYQCMIDFKDWGTSSCSVWSSDDNTSNPCVMKWYACGY